MALTANAYFTDSSSHSQHWARQLLLVSLSLKRRAPSDLIPTKKKTNKIVYSLENKLTWFVGFLVSIVSRQASLPQFRELRQRHASSPTQALKEHAEVQSVSLTSSGVFRQSPVCCLALPCPPAACQLLLHSCPDVPVTLRSKHSSLLLSMLPRETLKLIIYSLSN